MLGGRLFTGAVFKNYGMMMLNHQYEPAGFALTLGLKDVNLARSAAAGLGASMPTAELLKTNYDQAHRLGLAGQGLVGDRRSLSKEGRALIKARAAHSARRPPQHPTACLPFAAQKGRWRDGRCGEAKA